VRGYEKERNSKLVVLVWFVSILIVVEEVRCYPEFCVVR